MKFPRHIRASHRTQFSILRCEIEIFFKNILDTAGAIIKRDHLPEKASLADPFRAELAKIDKIRSSSQFWTSGQRY